MYYLQSKPPSRPWHDQQDWHTMFEGRAKYGTLEKALHALEYNSNLSRIIWPLRVIDDTGKLYGEYDPELDMRLPGCRWRAIQHNAYSLWEAAGKPDGEDEKFWHQAEQELPDNNGLVIYERTSNILPE